MAADALGRWLKQQGVSLTEATADHVRAYATSQPRTPAGKFRNSASGLTHLVEFLKPWGILCKPLPCSPAHEHLQRFDDYLQRVRGLALFTRGIAREKIDRTSAFKLGSHSPRLKFKTHTLLGPFRCVSAARPSSVLVFPSRSTLVWRYLLPAPWANGRKC